MEALYLPVSPAAHFPHTTFPPKSQPSEGKTIKALYHLTVLQGYKSFSFLFKVSQSFQKFLVFSLHGNTQFNFQIYKISNYEYIKTRSIYVHICMYEHIYTHMYIFNTFFPHNIPLSRKLFKNFSVYLSSYTYIQSRHFYTTGSIVYILLIYLVILTTTMYKVLYCI